MIALKNISKKFGKTQALVGIDLTIRPGLVTGLIGKNGSGKSTLINILTGLIQSFQGTVSYDKLEKTEISLASESFGFPSYYKASKVLGIFKVLKNTTAEGVEFWVDRLKITEHIDKPVKNLSQGNKQRLNIACALLGNPRFIIFDEPNNGLDPSGFVLLREIIQELKNEGKTILIASHLLNELESMCDRIIFLDNGKVIADKEKHILLDEYTSLEDAYLKLVTD